MRTTQDRTIVADRYALQATLRRDPGSVTWLANDVILDRRVALELVRPDLADDPEVVAAIDAATRALARASTTVLLGLLDAGVQDGLPFLVTEHVEGVSLDRVLGGGGPLGPDEAIAIGLQVLSALAEAHAAGIVHADVDPSAVTRTVDGVRVRTPVIGQALIRAGRAVTSPDDRPVPPEASEGRIDERTDVWFTAALLFELLTGHPPTQGARFVRAERRDVSRALEAVIARALAPDPVDRYPHVSAMRDALDGVARSRTRSEPEDEGWAVRRGVFRTWLAVPLLVAVVGAAVLGAGLWLGRLELGGPVGIRVHDETSPAGPATASPSAMAVTSVTAYDPFGDGEENSDNAPYASDGDRTTVWRSEDYYDADLNKEGVGLLLDLGRTSDVSSIRLWTPSPGFAFSVRVGEDVQELTDADVDETIATEDTRVQLEGSSGRYVLLWMTSVVPTGDGNRVEVADVRVLGTGR